MKVESKAMSDMIELNTQGLRCPEPIMMLHQVMRKAQAEQIIAMSATDPSTSWDIPKFCTHLGHTLLEQQQQDVDGKTIYFYQIQKKQA